jgi:hypothetical protein
MKMKMKMKMNMKTSQDEIEVMRIHEGQMFDFEDEEILIRRKQRERSMRS